MVLQGGTGKKPRPVAWVAKRLDRAQGRVYTTSMTDKTDSPNIEPATHSEPLRRAIGERYLT